MRFNRGIAVAAALSAISISAGAHAFETTSIGGTNSDGSMRYQDLDEAAALLSGSAASTTGSDQSWKTPLGSTGFNFSASQKSTSSEPSTPFNTPLLRERN
ncbi:hypothetical protein [Hyphomicrobium sp.]|uniref:hypothetical protein n=1 Tax=Hyphomicrobium sp. TaxID=82 RepID=UPI002D7A25D8|nr:hypothetical protein [Hyphomicrobium sp.]HET6389326.1 hypothetical protein [Hyphomicrobium sp.]